MSDLQPHISGVCVMEYHGVVVVELSRHDGPVIKCPCRELLSERCDAFVTEMLLSRLLTVGGKS